MTHLQAPSAVQHASLPASQPSHAFPALLGNRTSLTTSLSAKRAAVASLEAAWVAAAEAEADAARTNTRNVRMDDRSTWDRATWDRYLTAASTHEPDYKPRIKRLLRKIDNLEALLAIPEARVAQAA